MRLIEHLFKNSDCYRAGRTITPKGVMVHSLGVAQPNVDVFLSTWNVPGKNACVHAFVGRDRVVQALPWSWRGWHAGTGSGGRSANNTHISFEICEPAGHTYRGGTMIGYDAGKNAAYFADVYHNAVELTAHLCELYHLNPLEPGVVICHSEGHALGIASNHADVLHWFPKHGKDMDTFRADVARLLEGEDDDMEQERFNEMFKAAMAAHEQEVSARPVSAWAWEAWEKAVEQKVFDGTQPGGVFTREQAAVVLDRLGLIDGRGG